MEAQTLLGVDIETLAGYAQAFAILAVYVLLLTWAMSNVKPFDDGYRGHR